MVRFCKTRTIIDIQMLSYPLSMIYGAGTWTLTLEHQKKDSIDATQDVPTHRPDGKKYKSKKKKDKEDEDKTDDERSNNGKSNESEDGKSTSIGHDQDSNVSTEQTQTTTRAEPMTRMRIGSTLRSTREAEEKLRTFSIS